MNGEKRIALQVKRYKHPIELGEAHRFYGALVHNSFTSGVLVTSGRFRSGALKAAQELTTMTDVAIDVIDGKKLLDFIGVLSRDMREISALLCPYWRHYMYHEERNSWLENVDLR